MTVTIEFAGDLPGYCVNINLLVAMKINDEFKILGKIEHHAKKSKHWMFKKAQEIGFTETEIDLLKAIYDPAMSSSKKPSK